MLEPQAKAQIGTTWAPESLLGQQPAPVPGGLAVYTPCLLPLPKEV